MKSFILLFFLFFSLAWADEIPVSDHIADTNHSVKVDGLHRNTKRNTDSGLNTHIDENISSKMNSDFTSEKLDYSILFKAYHPNSKLDEITSNEIKKIYDRFVEEEWLNRLKQLERTSPSDFKWRADKYKSQMNLTDEDIDEVMQTLWAVKDSNSIAIILLRAYQKLKDKVILGNMTVQSFLSDSEATIKSIHSELRRVSEKYERKVPYRGDIRDETLDSEPIAQALKARDPHLFHSTVFNLKHRVHPKQPDVYRNIFKSYTPDGKDIFHLVEEAVLSESTDKKTAQNIALGAKELVLHIMEYYENERRNLSKGMLFSLTMFSVLVSAVYGVKLGIAVARGSLEALSTLMPEIVFVSAVATVPLISYASYMVLDHLVRLKKKKIFNFVRCYEAFRYNKINKPKPL